MTDKQIAADLARAVEGLRAYHGEAVPVEAELRLIGTEGEICERLGLSLDETEQGLTKNAVERIERFASDALGRKWTYA